MAAIEVRKSGGENPRQSPYDELRTVLSDAFVTYLKRKAAQRGLRIIEVAAAAQNHEWQFLMQFATGSGVSYWREICQEQQLRAECI